MKTSLYKDDLAHLFTICKDHKKDDQLSRLYVLFYAGSAFACALNGHTMGLYKMCSECLELEENATYSLSFAELADIVALKQDRTFFVYEGGELRAECGRVSIPLKKQEFGIQFEQILDRVHGYFSQKKLVHSPAMALLAHNSLDLVLPAKRKVSYHILQEEGNKEGMQFFIPEAERFTTPYMGICMPLKVEDEEKAIALYTDKGRAFFNIAD